MIKNAHLFRAEALEAQRYRLAGELNIVFSRVQLGWTFAVLAAAISVLCGAVGWSYRPPDCAAKSTAAKVCPVAAKRPVADALRSLFVAP